MRSSSPELDGLWLHDLDLNDPRTRTIVICKFEGEGTSPLDEYVGDEDSQEEKYEMRSGEDPYVLWDEHGECCFEDEAAPFDEYEGDEGDLGGAHPLDEFEGDEDDLGAEGAPFFDEREGDDLEDKGAPLDE